MLAPMTGTQQKRVKAQAVYKPLPWQVAPWRDMSASLLLAGAAGGGKTRFALEKIHGYCLHYPGSTGLLLRKTRESMNNSTVMFLDRVVIGRDPHVRHLKADHRFEYDNGSILAYGGMKDDEQREQIRGIGQDGGVDIAFMEEGVKFSENDYNEVGGRMRGKAGRFRQIIVATNPGPPGHWINQRLILGGEASVYLSRPEDNPHNPPEYIDTLKRLTGILRQRLYEGKWVQAEGLVYQEFDLDNLTDDEPEPGIPIELAYDDGYIDPRAILFIQRTESRILVFDELYHSRHLAETCVGEAVERCKSLGLGMPEIAIGSPEAKEMQGRLRQANIPSRTRPHEVVQGIQVVRELICDGNGYRTLRINRRCKNLIREITEGYQYPEEGTRRDSEKPLDGNDHACFVAGTMILTQSGVRPIETIAVGDKVLTRNGYRPVVYSAMTDDAANVMTVTFSNGSCLRGTGNHPILANGIYTPMQSLMRGDKVVTPGVSTTVYVGSVFERSEPEPVYNLTVDNTVGEGEYFANGVLVHNCDALRYWCFVRGKP